MKHKKTALCAGISPVQVEEKDICGSYLDVGGEKFYRISNYDEMTPFLMSIVSSSDHWLFISSSGGLTAGRRNAGNSLFPYCTEDKITDNSGNTGSRTILIVDVSGRKKIWEPFSHCYERLYRIERNLYKNVTGNKIIFEEINKDLEIGFKYSWMTSDRFGFVKRSGLSNLGKKIVEVDILDGIMNVLPYGVTNNLQTEKSCLIDAYKRNEFHPEQGLALFTLSSILTDKAEPNEALKATAIWSEGFDKPVVLLSSSQIDQFRKGKKLSMEHETKGVRGSYFLNSTARIKPNSAKTWSIVAALEQDKCDISILGHLLSNRKALRILLDEDIEDGSKKLISIAASADALQMTGDSLSSNHHFSNVVFNLMRGGVIDDNGVIDTEDLLKFIDGSNAHVYRKYNSLIRKLGKKISRSRLIAAADKAGDGNLERICMEYLPLIFSRRHGDPSRPWNTFSIELKDADGGKMFNYQGNWRDIFQNWEALSLSFPEFIENIICKFLNASTADGYNPYRLTRGGIEWEEHEPNNPWSNIGYWGDHQIIYLLKLLEWSRKFHPEMLGKFLAKRIFSYANVPYEIKSYCEIVANGRDSIVFNHEKNAHIHELAGKYGSDGKLVLIGDDVLLVNFTEKILACLLSKISNFVPEGGIWLNTQRPEWNDANNALAGYGLSMVTLYYMRRFVVFMKDLFGRFSAESYGISEEILAFFKDIKSVLKRSEHLLDKGFDDVSRRFVLDALGGAGTSYRNKIYGKSFSGLVKNLDSAELNEFFNLALKFIDQSIKINRRRDGLYHSYNILDISSEKKASVSCLYEMLEGQAAVLSSGYIGAEETCELLETMRKGPMYRGDQHSYMLYPERSLPSFMEKNNVPKKLVHSSLLLKKLISEGDKSIIARDADGICHFNGNFRNSDSLLNAMEVLGKEKRYESLVIKERNLLVEIFEEVFNHRFFTGRSGTFFAYEGLGSVYWHMVSKLLLAVQEIYFNAADSADEKLLHRLSGAYYGIRNGLGFNKYPQDYGAFPTDPYSHTPVHTGARQPGMTGQVKEEILTRLGELGLNVENGRICFLPLLLREGEFLSEKKKFEYYTSSGGKEMFLLSPGSLAFTFCQTPIVYSISKDESIELDFVNGKHIEINGNELDGKTSSSIFRREGLLRLVHARISKSRIRRTRSSFPW